MSETVEAIYENGVFRLVGEISLPEGIRVRVETPPVAAPPFVGSGKDLAEQIRQRLLAEGAAPADAKRILDNLHLLWASLEGLTEEEQKTFEQAKLNQQDFFALSHN
ncbi:MAG: antitoxin AF2212-like protein [Blastocatellia bacterium]